MNNESLLAVPIRDDEIFELLDRLAATEEMFKTPVSTIRDVAELTDATPALIARILGEIRGPDEFERLVKRVEALEGSEDTVVDPMAGLDPQKVFTFAVFAIAGFFILVMAFMSQCNFKNGWH